jgi:ATP-dependent DNA helicase RecG
MNTQELAGLLSDVESDRAERTVAVRDKDKLCEAICAFSNDMPHSGLPGYLFVNAKPDGSAGPLEITDQLLQNLAAIRSDGNIQPLPVINVQKQHLGGGEMAVVEVFPSDAPPVRYHGRIWIRVGPRRAIANESEERILSERRAATASRTWDIRPCREVSLDDLELDLFAVTYRAFALDRDVLAENGRQLTVQMASLRLFDLKAAVPTNAGVLLFAKDVLAHVPGAYVQYVRYAGLGEDSSVQEERRFEGDLLTLLRSLDQWAESLAETRPVAAGNEIAEQTVHAYPPKSLHELLMNAVIHRNYDGSTTPIMLSQFDDRLEISNPGSLYGDLTKADFPRLTSYRNPVLAEAAKTLGFVNRFGRGIDLAQSYLRRNGSPEAGFSIGQNHFLATVWRRP